MNFNEKLLMQMFPETRYIGVTETICIKVGVEDKVEVLYEIPA